MSTADDLSKASQEIGTDIKLSLLKQTGRLRIPAAQTAEDVVGFDYLVHDTSGGCYQYYAANPPLIGLTRPTPVPCPLGIATFDDYKIDYKQAVDIFHKGNWGSRFTSIVISKPLHPSVQDPFWYFVSDTGVHVMINANTGEPGVAK